MVVLASSLLFIAGPFSALAVGSFNNSAIATAAEAYPNGSWGGQCKAFANTAVRTASQGAINLTGYQSGYAAKGGIEVSPTNSVRGDIIQITPAGSTDSTAEALHNPYSSAHRLHTAIVLKYNGGGNFDVIDSNWTYNETVLRHGLNPYTWASGSIIKIWRMGTVTNPAPPPPPDYGNEYALNNNFDGYHDILTTYGNGTDQILVGDWDGNGTQTLGVRRGNEFYLNYDFDGQHNIYTTYGRSTDGIIVGDWDGNGSDTLGVRQGNQYYLNNSFDASHDIYTAYGSSTDQVVVGDWDGDGKDTLGIRRGNTYYLNNNFDGQHDALVSYGNTTQPVIVGDWNGDGVDTLGVRDGRNYLLNNNFDGQHDILTTYGREDDGIIVGDWNGDGVTTLGVRRN